MIGNRTYIEISGDNLRHNCVQLTQGLPAGVISMSVIKSNAYGHGLLQTAWALAETTSWFAVDDIEEAKILRQHGIHNPILILGAVPEEWYPVARSLRLTVTSTSMITLRWAANHGVQTHIKLDTGLGRQGFLPGDEYVKLVQYLGRNKPVVVTGLYTHFAVADSPSEIDFTMSQFELFQDMANELQELLQCTLIRHVSGTSGAIYRNEFACDMVRLGIGLYGVWPSESLEQMMSGVELLPVMKWVSIISEVKHIPKGHSVGYDRTHIVKKDTILGIVPVGYWHGFPRALSGTGFVTVRGKRAPVVGIVSMDMMAVDLTALAGEILIGESVLLIGGGISAYELASAGGMSHYELLTRINPFIERRLR